MNTPVALIIFNRPDCARLVFDRIAQSKPKKLFVIADGPRPDRPDDAEKCAAARAVIEIVDWDCEVATNFSDVNLGCNQRVVTGVNWVFEQVEQAIILEDDCLPDPSFFTFCEELLDRYRDDERVMMIGGVNFLGEWKTPHQSYYFSYFGGTWGWASWRRAWRLNDPEMKIWPVALETRLLENMFPNHRHVDYWKEIFQKLYDEPAPDTWDYQWLLACWINSGYRIFPEVNLISNLGFRIDATHTLVENQLANMPTTPISFPLKRPPMMARSVEADNLIQELFCPAEIVATQPNSLATRIAGRIRTVVSPIVNTLGYEISRKAEKPEPDDADVSDFDREALEKIRIVRQHTMLPYARLYSLYDQAVYCETAGVAGSFVECGVWRGGAVALMALANLAHGKARRPIHLFDSFEGIPEPDEAVDGAKAVNQARAVGAGAQGRLIPLANFYERAGALQANRDLLENIIGYDPGYLRYHQGWFQDTLPREAGEVGDIAILRLDGDWYASTRVCLEHLYHRVVSGGFIIIDDYGCYEGCRKAVDEFMEREGVRSYLHRIDSEGRYLIKA